MKKENWKIHKYVVIKQDALEQPLGQGWYQKGNLKNTMRQMKMEIHVPKLMQCCKSSSKSEVHSNKSLH